MCRRRRPSPDLRPETPPPPCCGVQLPPRLLLLPMGLPHFGHRWGIFFPGAAKGGAPGDACGDNREVLGDRDGGGVALLAGPLAAPGDPCLSFPIAPWGKAQLSPTCVGTGTGRSPGRAGGGRLVAPPGHGPRQGDPIPYGGCPPPPANSGDPPSATAIPHEPGGPTEIYGARDSGLGLRVCVPPAGTPPPGTTEGAGGTPTPPAKQGGILPTSTHCHGGGGEHTQTPVGRVPRDPGPPRAPQDPPGGAAGPSPGRGLIYPGWAGPGAGKAAIGHQRKP